jgi:hypothetical protein
MPGETKPAAGRMDSRNADAPAFKRGGVRAVQQVSPNRMGDRCAPHHVRRRTRQRPGLNERSISSILREHRLVNNRTEHQDGVSQVRGSPESNFEPRFRRQFFRLGYLIFIAYRFQSHGDAPFAIPLPGPGTTRRAPAPFYGTCR